jgi:hypothetical protein
MSAAVKTPTRPLVIALTALLAWFACDRSPTAVLTSPLPTARSNPPAPSPSTGAHTGLVTCLQAYDSVTQAIGPTGGAIAVGHHVLWVDSLALTSPVSITAVAPSDTVRWVRFHPDGLIFQTKTKTGYPAIILTDYTSCGVPTSDTLRIAQVSDSRGILGYLQTYVKFNKNPWSRAAQYVAAVLPHFSNYAVAW